MIFLSLFVLELRIILYKISYDQLVSRSVLILRDIFEWFIINIVSTRE